MTETANILHNATEYSLVLMDEIGRGTSTYDGLSLAWACAENLANKIKALTLFATHYFELTQLPEKMEGVANVHLDALEHGDTIAFMHSVQDGAASKSYGLAVAALAGVPKRLLSAHGKNCVSWKAFRRTPPRHRSMARRCRCFQCRKKPRPRWKRWKISTRIHSLRARRWSGFIG